MKPIWTIVLAAGASTRFGASKMLVSYDGEPLLRSALRAARTATPRRVLLVTGRDAAKVAAACGDLADRVVLNPGYERGIGSSISCGISELGPDVEGAIVALADQVLVNADHFRNLIHSWSGESNAIAATRFHGRVGPPALFGRAAFSRLAELDADSGGLSILNDPAFTLSEVTFDAAAVDIDTPADLNALTEGRD